MKKILFVLFSIAAIISAQNLQVTNTEIYSVDIPHIALGGSSVHMVYGTNFRCYNFDVNGPTVPISNPVIPADNFAPNTTDIDVDPLDNNHIAIAYYDYHYDSNSGVQFYGCYVTESLDGGLTFDTPTLLDTIEYGNTITNLSYNMPQVKFQPNDDASQLYVLWRVNSNKIDTNALYMAARYGHHDRMDDPGKNALELAVGFTVEDMIAVSYGIMEDGHAKFYLSGSGVNQHLLVKDDGQTFLTTDHFTKAFFNHGGKLEYIFNDFAHNAKLMESNDWGASWTDKGIIDSHQYTYVAFTRIKPTFPYYLESYYVKLLKDDNDDLVFSVSPDLLQWQDGGKINDSNSQVSGMASTFIDLKLDDINRFLTTAWIDSRTGNEEIFYAKTNLPIIAEVNTVKLNPTEFRLFQNYPNPFNPSTTIKYSIPSKVKSEKSNVASGFSLRNVTLKIYDLLGREVATLINQKQKPGNYEVKFDASNYSSGIYFYRIQTGEYHQTRKMILTK